MPLDEELLRRLQLSNARLLDENRGLRDEVARLRERCEALLADRERARLDTDRWRGITRHPA